MAEARVARVSRPVVQMDVVMVETLRLATTEARATTAMAVTVVPASLLRMQRVLVLLAASLLVVPRLAASL